MIVQIPIYMYIISIVSIRSAMHCHYFWINLCIRLFLAVILYFFMTDIKAKIIVISISVLHRWKTRYAFDIEHFTIYGCDLLFLTLLSINIRIWRKWWENVKSLVLMSQYYRKERMVIEIYKLVHLVNGQNYCWIIEQLSLLQSPPPQQIFTVNHRVRRTRGRGC